jgi:hypothetical protein
MFRSALCLLLAVTSLSTPIAHAAFVAAPSSKTTSVRPAFALNVAAKEAPLFGT